jgi:hypothetical protein
MKAGVPLTLCLVLAAGPAFGGATVEQEGPLTPCVQTPSAAAGNATDAQTDQSWGVEIATAFSKEEALAEFAQAKQDYADILGSYDPDLIEQCDLHMGTKLQYSARIKMDTREDADALCAKLRASGGACIVQKN